jgi:hypothetical protein
MKITKKLATKLHSAASRNQKERACLEITKYKLQTNPKLQITKKWCGFFRLKCIVMIWFTDAVQNILAKKTRS